MSWSRHGTGAVGCDRCAKLTPSLEVVLRINDDVKLRFARFSPNRPENDCWEWTGWCHPRGYGKLSVEGRTEAAHRVSWAIHFGEDPGKLHVLHKCDNPSCVNPAHLFLGTDLDNNQDMIAKGRNIIIRGERHGRSPFTDADVRIIRERWTSGASFSSLAREFGVSRVAIRNICLKRSWSHVD